MKLDKKKELSSKVLNVGKGRIWFDPLKLADIKEAITKQDILDLFKQKVIKIKQITGKLKKKKRKTRRMAGSISKKVQDKKAYPKKVRKLRSYLKSLGLGREISNEEYQKLRRYIKAGIFPNVKRLKEFISSRKK